MTSIKINLPFFLVISVCLFTHTGCNPKKAVFTEVPSSKTNIHFRNDLKERKGLSILYYLYYYNGGGVSVGDINNDGLADIYFTANSTSNNKLYLNKGNFEFEDEHHRSP